MKQFRISSEEITEQYVKKYLPFALRYAQDLCDSGVISQASRTFVAAKMLYYLLEIRGVRPDDASMRGLEERIEGEEHKLSYRGDFKPLIRYDG